MFTNTFKNSKIIITGHTGFKGSWLSLWLSELGANVIGISDGVPTVPSHFDSLNISQRIKNINCDINELDKLKRIILNEKPDFLFHLAAQSIVSKSLNRPVKTFETNIVGTINVLESLRELTNKCTSIIITSDKCYKNKEWTWGYRENDELGGFDPYSASKACAEICIESYFNTFFCKKSYLKICSTRAGNVIGGGDWAEGRIIPDCVKSWIKNEIVFIRNPKSTRPWQHVLEPLSGYLLLADILHRDSNEINGNSFNFGPSGDQNSSVGYLVKEISNYWPNSKWEFSSKSKSNLNECNLLKLNCDKAQSKLGWYPVWDLEKTISQTINWYKNFYLEKNYSSIDFSIAQIKHYQDCAKDKGLKWAIQ